MSGLNSDERITIAFSHGFFLEGRRRRLNCPSSPFYFSHFDGKATFEVEDNLASNSICVSAFDLFCHLRISIVNQFTLSTLALRGVNVNRKHLEEIRNMPLERVKIRLGPDEALLFQSKIIANDTNEEGGFVVSFFSFDYYHVL